MVGSRTIEYLLKVKNDPANVAQISALKAALDSTFKSASGLPVTQQAVAYKDLAAAYRTLIAMTVEQTAVARSQNVQTGEQVAMTDASVKATKDAILASRLRQAQLRTETLEIQKQVAAQRLLTGATIAGAASTKKAATGEAAATGFMAGLVGSHASEKGGLGESARINDEGHLRLNIFSRLNSFVDIAIAAIIGNKVLEIADDFTKLASKIRLNTATEQQAVAVRQRLVDVSIATHSSLEQSVDTWEKLTIVGGRYHKTVGEMINMQEGLYKALRVGGASNTQAQQSLQSLAVVMDRGRMSGQGLQQIFRTSPEFMNMLAEAMQKPINYFSQMRTGSKGAQKAAEEFFSGIQKLANSPELKEKFLKIPISMAEGWQDAKTGFEVMIGSINEKLKISGGVGTFFEKIGLAFRDPNFIKGAAAFANIIGGLLIKALDQLSKALDFVREHTELMTRVFTVLGYWFEVRLAVSLLKFATGLGSSATLAYTLGQKLFGLSKMITGLSIFKDADTAKTALNTAAIRANTIAVENNAAVRGSVGRMGLGTAVPVVGNVGRMGLGAAEGAAAAEAEGAGSGIAAAAALALNAWVAIPAAIAAATAAVYLFGDAIDISGNNTATLKDLQLAVWDQITSAVTEAGSTIVEVWDYDTSTIADLWAAAGVTIGTVIGGLLEIVGTVASGIVTLFLGAETNSVASWSIFPDAMDVYFQDAVKRAQGAAGEMADAFSRAAATWNTGTFFGGVAGLLLGGPGAISTGATLGTAVSRYEAQQAAQKHLERFGGNVPGATRHKLRLPTPEEQDMEDELNKTLPPQPGVGDLGGNKKKKKGSDRLKTAIESLDDFIARTKEANKYQDELNAAILAGPEAERNAQVAQAYDKTKLEETQKLIKAGAKYTGSIKDGTAALKDKNLVDKVDQAAMLAKDAEIKKQQGDYDRLVAGINQQTEAMGRATVEGYKQLQMWTADGAVRRQRIIDLARENAEFQKREEFVSKQMPVDEKAVKSAGDAAARDAELKKYQEEQATVNDLLQKNDDYVTKGVSGWRDTVAQVQDFVNRLGATPEQLKAINDELNRIKPPETLMDSMRTAIQGFRDDFEETWSKVADGIKGTIEDLANNFTDMAMSGKFSFKQLALSVIQDLERMIIKALAFKAIMAVLNAVMPGLGSVVGAAGSGFTSPFAAGGYVKKYAGGGAVQHMAGGGIMKKIMRFMSPLGFILGSKHPARMAMMMGSPVGLLMSQMHAEGGHIAGPGTSTSDSIPAMLSNGEFVLRADAVKKWGRPLLDAMNTGSLSPSDMGKDQAEHLAGGGILKHLMRFMSPLGFILGSKHPGRMAMMMGSPLGLLMSQMKHAQGGYIAPQHFATGGSVSLPRRENTGGGGSNIFAPNINITVGDSDGKVRNQDGGELTPEIKQKLGNMLEGELGIHLQRKFEEWTRPGGQLYQFVRNR